MPSSYSLSSLIFVTLAVVVFSVINPASSTSRRVVDHEQHTVAVHAQTGFHFQVPLNHVDSGKNLTKLELIQRGIKRGQHRLQRLSADSHVEAPVHAGTGEFLINLAIGTPPETFSAIIDTGSDLIWTQCKPCTQCYDQPTPIFDPNKSSSFTKISCKSELCDALPSSTCGPDGCEYLYQYGDYSLTQGVMATETFTFGDSKNLVSIPEIGFGCGNDNEGNGFNQGAGLVGLGRGPLSLVSQLNEPKFSYCLTSIDNSDTSTLLLGPLATQISSQNPTQTTPLIKNPSQPSFYYLSLQGISVGDTRLPTDKSAFQLRDDGSGGLIIDSGTTITYIDGNAFDLLKKEFTSKINLPADDSGSSGLDLCYTLPSDSDTNVEIPSLVFHFEGADLDLPLENYIVVDPTTGLLCLAMGSSGSSGMSIFGNIQQQNFLVIHDLVKETLSFISTQCDQFSHT